MKDDNFSQLPVLDADGKYVGMLTELSIVKFFLSPKSNELIQERGLNDLKVAYLREERRKATHGKEGKPRPAQQFRSGFLEETEIVSSKESLRSVAVSLIHHYAVLLGKDPSNWRIMTRADFLKATNESRRALISDRT
jgi:predicted transcriptional regulator